MRVQRIIWFSIAILFGTAAGLAAGWVFFPPAGSSVVAPDTLREDYKADYVLMTAEIYAQDGNLDDAAARLRFLGEEPPLQYVQRAILTGQDLGFAPADMQALANLFTGLQSLPTGTPAATP